MQKLLLDENIGAIVADALKKRGFDVKSILEETRGADDLAVLARAKKEKRILVTLDRDFGQLVFQQSKKHVGVIFLRLKKESPKNIILALTAILEQYGTKIQNRFVTASETRIRIR